MIAALAVAERSTSAAMERSELHETIKSEVDLLIEGGYGEIHIIVANDGKSVDIINAPRKRCVLGEHEQRISQDK